MAAEDVITLGIGSAPGSLRPFITFGLSSLQGASPATVMPLRVAIADRENSIIFSPTAGVADPVASKNSVEV